MRRLPIAPVLALFLCLMWTGVTYHMHKLLRLIDQNIAAAQAIPNPKLVVSLAVQRQTQLHYERFWAGTSLIWGCIAIVLTYHRRERRRRDRRERGLCAKCSYDLTGNVSGICPECGMPIGSFR